MSCINTYTCTCVAVMVIIDYKLLFIYVSMTPNVLNPSAINMCCCKILSHDIN